MISPLLLAVSRHFCVLTKMRRVRSAIKLRVEPRRMVKTLIGILARKGLKPLKAMRKRIP